MHTPKATRLPRKFTITLLKLYILMGVVSMLAGGYLSYTSYQMRVYQLRIAGHSPGTFYVMLVGGVIIAFGVWRCVLACYHLYRLSRVTNRS